MNDKSLEILINTIYPFISPPSGIDFYFILLFSSPENVLFGFPQSFWVYDLIILMRLDYRLENTFKEYSMICKSGMIKHTLESKLKSIRPHRQRMPQIYISLNWKYYDMY